MKYQKFAIVLIWLCSSAAADAVSIYKCTKNDQTVIFADKPCPNMDVKLIYTETEQEIKRRILEEKITTIKRLIANNQSDAAKDYALKNNLSEFYRTQLAIYTNEKAEAEKQTAEQDRQRQLSLQQQAIQLQQQQLELQKRQLAVEKEKAEQQMNNRTYYSYPYYSRVPKSPCQPPYCVTSLPSKNISSGGMNPPPSSVFSVPMNPPQSFPARMNPP